MASTYLPRKQILRRGVLSWQARLLFLALILIGAVSIWWTNRFMMDRFEETTRTRADLRLTLYAGNLISELRRNAIVPQLLSRDSTLIAALSSNDFAQSSQRLISYADEIGAANLFLLDLEGRVVAATDRTRLGETHRTAPYFVDALRSNDTVFNALTGNSAGYRFLYSRRLELRRNVLGAIVVEVDLQKFERAWSGISDEVLVTDSGGTIILATVPKWRGMREAEALQKQDPENAIERAILATSDWSPLSPDAYLNGRPVIRTPQPVGFRGWNIVGFTSYTSVRERVNAVLAFMVMGYALLMALGFYILNRRAVSQMTLFERESAELRVLNQRLQREIAERERVQKTLEVAEQSLAQSSKLAALGQMSAAISHELNQPLAAMRTYLAGAKLLLKRNRPQEAQAAILRIDDLIARMTSITQQLKSYARKGGDQFVPVDIKDAFASALSIMDINMRQGRVAITKILPDEPAMVLADRVRLEQVIVNLLRNAIDATKNVEQPQIDVLVTVGETVRLSVRDNGDGIDDFESLFEPFYTTKQPGDGVGLGLAISSGIVGDLGGRLIARNGEDGGAVFEVQLPILNEEDRLSDS